YRRELEVARYQSWSADYLVAEAEALVAGQPGSGWPEPGEWVQLGLHLADGTDVLIGDVAVGADAEQPATFELGVTLASAHQGQGYAREALEVVLARLMDERGAHRVVMQGDARNAPVLALMRRLGLRHEGTILEGDWFKDEWTTLERFALLDHEWRVR
ncbi:MAG: GNAT family N-acetyltransferase, partial [Actinomycetes bacterium]